MTIIRVIHLMGVSECETQEYLFWAARRHVILMPCTWTKWGSMLSATILHVRVAREHKQTASNHECGSRLCYERVDVV